MSLFVEDEENEHIQNELQPEIPEQESLVIPISTEIPVEFHEPSIIPIYPTREVNCTLPLKYQQEIVEDMLTKDGLLVLGRGLGWELVTANLLHALSSPFTIQGDQPKRSLLFLLNAKDEEVMRIKDELTDLHWLDSNSTGDVPFVVITGDSHNTSNKRKDTYLKGGVISITSRVLVVDLLSGLLSPKDITGLFILHAERLKETSNDAFIINIYRDQNDWGFIKAVSDEPEAITGFTPLATKLKILRLSNVFLWPRFHVEVSSSLGIRGKNLLTRQKQEHEQRRFVTEINTKMTYKMTKIQSSIMSCIQACLQELKRHNPDLATEYWDMDNVHDSDFARRIRISLDAHWHRLSYTTKQLVFDITTLTDLLTYLVTLDSVSFYQIIQGIIDVNIKHVSSGGLHTNYMSPWLSLDESNTIIAYSRERALGKVKVSKKRVINVESDEEEQPAGDDETEEEYILEELPKWDQLGKLLDDILHEKSVSTTKDQGPILIMCSSPKIADQLMTLIESMKEHVNPMTGKNLFSFRKYMIKRLQGYLQWKEVNSLVKKINSDLNTNETPDSRPKSEEPVTEEELQTSKTFSKNGIPTSKRRRTRGASSGARVNRLYSGTTNERNNEAVDIDDKIMQKLKMEENDDDNEIVDLEDEIFINDDETGDGGFFFDSVLAKEITYEHISKDDQIIVQAYNERNNDALLQELGPSYIIMYEPNLSFIRRVEIYQAINKARPAKTYFMYYGSSVEEEKHLLRIKKEKEAFTKLIREKALLSKHFETSEDNRMNVNRNKVLNTRIAGGANFRTENDELRIVVDLREFGSSLPNLLYRVGIKIIPCMITVGDYIVSPKICVERKSIPDLISSFKSGRLYQQCEQMFRHYELPTLLIEFDESKSFSLSRFSESRFQRVNPTNPTATQLMQQNIQSKIMLLLISFPKLKIIWSSSPYETAQIFLKLKANQEEPDIGDALDKGVNKSVVTQDGGPPIFNDDPIDFIQNIPGINSVNFHLIIQKVKSIEEMVKLTKDQFVIILGEENGRKAYNFVNHTIR